MAEKDQLPPSKKPVDINKPPQKPAAVNKPAINPAVVKKPPLKPPPVKKTLIPPTNQVTDMSMEPEMDLLKPRPGQAPKPVPASAAPPVIKHVWTKEDTYADLAFRYYGSIKDPYWRLIYDHNKHIIGDHPNDIRVGLEIEIPPLPPELMKK